MHKKDRETVAREAGRITFSQEREEAWKNATAKEKEARYAHKDMGTRKTGMLGVSSGSSSKRKNKHGRKGRPTQPLGGRSGRFYRAH